MEGRPVVQWRAERQLFTQSGTDALACPFFMPTRKCEEAAWLHPARLPLGAGWQGICTAHPDREVVPSDFQLQAFCNLGYAKQCPHLPVERTSDAVRFCVSQDCEGRIVISYVCESGHAPAGHGTLEYDALALRWVRIHSDARIQKMAECHLEMYLSRTKPGSFDTISSDS